MHKTIKTLSIVLLSSTLCACIYNEGEFRFQPYDERTVSNPPQTYQNFNDYNYKAEAQREEKREVVVPETYHMQTYQGPQAHKSRDRRWVETQDPKGYTIEVADSSRPSEVANKLHQAPRNQRMAEVQYRQNGSAYYKGLYGSYSSYEEAERALHSLPEEVRSGAKISTWNKVQSNVGNE